MYVDTKRGWKEWCFMSKVIFDALMLLLIMAVPFFLASSRLHSDRAKAALYEAATHNPGIRG